MAVTSADRAFERIVDRHTAGGGRECVLEVECANDDCHYYDTPIELTGVVDEVGTFEWQCPGCGSVQDKNVMCDDCKCAPCVCPD